MGASPKNLTHSPLALLLEEGSTFPFNLFYIKQKDFFLSLGIILHVVHCTPVTTIRVSTCSFLTLSWLSWFVSISQGIPTVSCSLQCYFYPPPFLCALGPRADLKTKFHLDNDFRNLSHFCRVFSWMLQKCYIFLHQNLINALIISGNSKSNQLLQSAKRPFSAGYLTINSYLETNTQLQKHATSQIPLFHAKTLPLSTQVNSMDKIQHARLHLKKNFSRINYLFILQALFFHHFF